MSKKYTIEFIKFEFEKKGWVCTSKEYVNNKTPLKYICPEGHIGAMIWNNWKNGHGCLECSGNKKHTIEFVKSEFEKKGWICTSDEYINNSTLLSYICSNGHEGSITWSSWQQEIGCSICVGVKKLTIEFVKSEFEKEGWICTSDEYINSYSKLNYICPEGHHGSITWLNWSQGNRCPICSGVKKLTIEFVKSEFEKKGWVCTSEEYVSNTAPLKYICSEGHCGSITWTHWNRGVGCSACAVINKIGAGNPNWKGGISYEPYCPIWKDKEYAESIKQRDGYKCMNPCCNSKDPDDLTRHHINYDKKDCRLKNIITACRSCNGGANFDREFHEAWYKAIMYRRYGYTYE